MANHSIREITGSAIRAVELSLPGCDLCGLPQRYGTFTTIVSGKTLSFCCLGCKQVFTMLMEASDTPDPTQFKDTELFQKCREMGIIPGPESDLEHLADEESPSLLSEPAPNPAEYRRDIAKENILSLHLKVTDMWCPACAWVIEESLRKGSGVVNAACNFSTDRVRCDYNPVLTSPSQIISTIGKLGYRASVPGEEMHAQEKKTEFIRFAVSAVLMMNVMMFSFALYSGFFRQLAPESISTLSWPVFIMASIVLFYGGEKIFQKAWAGLSSARYSMETLIATGSLSAYLYSTFNLFAGSIHLYFDTASMLITLVLLGKMLERKAKDRIQEDLENFFSLQPTKVRICSPLYPEGRYAAAEHLKKEDVFRVEESEIVPADGIIAEGAGLVDESSLTGEAFPVSKKPGEQLRSGTRIVQGTFKARAGGVGKDSTLGQMMEVIEKALGQKTSLEGKTDRILQWFVPLILVLTIGTGLGGIFSGLSGEESLIRAVTVMIISCPCALGIAIPLARVAGISEAGRKGILVRDFSSFEQAEKVDTFVFDKTGTITKGQWELGKIIPLGSLPEDQILALTVALERDSDHPIALEIKRWAKKNCIKAVEAERIVFHKNGISGQIGKNEVKIGSRTFLSKEIKRFGPLPPHIHSPWSDTISSTVYLSHGGKLSAVFIFGDTIREGAAPALKELHSLGYALSLISGDGDNVTKAIGEKLGVKEALGEKLPQDKGAFIETLQKQGHQVAMVGDGINDAPALTQADLAIAVHSGSHLGKEVADLTLMRGDPRQILDFLKLAKRVNKKVYQNLFACFLYNFISIPIAMSGLLTPLVAVCAMLLSSLSVIGNTFLLTRKAS